MTAQSVRYGRFNSGLSGLSSTIRLIAFTDLIILSWIKADTIDLSKEDTLWGYKSWRGDGGQYSAWHYRSDVTDTTEVCGCHMHEHHNDSWFPSSPGAGGPSPIQPWSTITNPFWHGHSSMLRRSMSSKVRVNGQGRELQIWISNCCWWELLFSHRQAWKYELRNCKNSANDHLHHLVLQAWFQVLTPIDAETKNIYFQA